jgi:hypothetical protein
VGAADDSSQIQINAALKEWRQGDCVLGEHWFLFRLNVHQPLTGAAEAAAAEGTDAGESQVQGLMVATQTCDIIRDCCDRPYIEVCPLIEVDADMLGEIQRGRRPNRAFVPGVEEHNLVADLDRIMTVEKGVILNWERVAGCRNDTEIRYLSQALSRKRARFAFPNDFAVFVEPLRQRLSSKHNKNSNEGRALRALREVRVRAAPSWEAEQVEIMFWFIREEDEPQFEGKDWHGYKESWLARVPAAGRFSSIYGSVVTLDGLTAREYVESDQLDLDHLSTGSDND